jgi:hypothetical protein
MGFFSRFFHWNDNATPEPTPPAPPPGSELGLDAKAAAAILAELDIDAAIAAHENWKARLQAQLHQSRTENLDPAVVCQDDRCALGQWLHGPGRERLGKYPAFSVLVARHQYFHVQASTVVAQVHSGDRASAERTLDTGFRHASNQVLLLLKELKRGLGGR